MEKVDYLNEAEEIELTKFADNKLMFSAVKKVLLAGIYYNGTLIQGKAPIDPTKNFALTTAAVAQMDSSITDETIGRNLRASSVGINLVNFGFEKCEAYKTGAKREEKTPISGR